jgi:transposase
VNSITAVKNRIRALLKGNGYTRPASKGSWWKVINRVWMRSFFEDVGITSEELWRMSLADMMEQLYVLEDQLKRVTKYLDSYLDKQPWAKVLLSIGGVGPRTVEAVLAYTDDVRRFSRGKAYCSYFGFTPRLDESGSVRRMGHISKQGPSVVRWLVTEASWRAIKKSAGLRAFYERVRCGQAGRKKIAIVAVARKLLSIMRAMQISGELFNEKLVCRECGDSELLKVKEIG